MGLFDAFRGGSAPGVYAPWMTYDPGAPEITPSQPVTPSGPLDTTPQTVSIPKGPSFWDRMSKADPQTGLTKWQQLGLVGASLRDDPAVYANAQNSMMEQGKLALSNQMTRQQMALASAFAGGMRGGQAGAPAPVSRINGQPVPQMAQPSAAGGPAVPQVGAGGGLPNIPGAAQQMVTPEMRQLAAMGAFNAGKYDQAVSILDDDGHYTVTPQGYVLNGKSGQVVGQVPNFQYINNVRVNPNDPGAPPEIAKLPDGMVHLPGGGAANAAGLTAAMGAQAAATAAGTASQDLISIKMPDGSEQQVPRDVAAAILRSQTLGGVAGGGVPGGFGRSQTPADKITAEGTAKTAVERKASEPQQFAGLQDQGRATDLAIQTINDVLGQSIDAKGNVVQARPSMINGFNSGFGANLGGIKGTGAYNLEQKLSPLKAIIGFGELQKMRQNSPTGGALGQVSERENSLLQSLYGSMDPGQNPQQFAKELTQVRDQLLETKRQREQLYSKMYTQGGQPAQAAQPTTSGKGYRIVGVR